MPVDRPTFSESWYRVADLKPRLRSTVQTYRQFFRGQPWHVVEDPTSNQFFRIDEAGYAFIGLLDGRMSVREAWDHTNQRMGDAAPTQGEAIQLLGQLYASNLLSGEMADAAGMFERYRKRRSREVRGYLMNLLFVRIPLFDPERILEAWVSVFGWFFSWIGLAVWAAVVAVGGWHLIGQWDRFTAGADAQSMLAVDNLLMLYLGFALTKAVHEFGHGFACKRFGKLNGAGGQVHTIGIMLLVFMPVPYVDASSSYAFRSKWQRAFVGAAGMYVELALASIAAVVWARTTDGPINDLAYNMIFVASVSTLLFNANPLLRYDGYYILSDLLEIPNLAQRSKDYLYYLVKKYAFGVRRPRDPSHTVGERPWLLVYAIASTVYRIIISVAIFFYVAQQLFVIGMVLAMGAVVTWVFVPLGKFLKYLFVGQELVRVRTRAKLVTACTAAAALILIGLIPAPDRSRASGVVKPDRVEVIHARTEGVVTAAAPSATFVKVDSGEPLLVAENRQLLMKREELRRAADAARSQLDGAIGVDPSAAMEHQRNLRLLEDQLAELQQRIDDLTIRPPMDGLWITPQLQRSQRRFVRSGEEVGKVVSLDRLIIRAVADQSLGPRLEEEVSPGQKVDIRVEGRPETHFEGTIRLIYPAGTRELPSDALQYQVGGSIAVQADERGRAEAVDPFFEVVIDPDPGASSQVLPGQRVIVRFTTPSKPLIVQWWRALRQLIQQKLS